MIYPLTVIPTVHYISGWVLGVEGFYKGFIGFERGEITEIGKGTIDNAEAKGLIVPTFVDAHTHITDYLVPVDLSLSLAEVVAPPNGLKYRVLNSTPSVIQKGAMSTMSDYMFRHGTSVFADFREGGVQGSAALRSIDNGAHPFIMGKPLNPHFNKEESFSSLGYLMVSEHLRYPIGIMGSLAK